MSGLAKLTDPDVGSSKVFFTGRKLTFSKLWPNSADDKLIYFRKKKIDSELSPEETVCMKCQSLFSGEKKKIFQNVAC